MKAEKETQLTIKIKGDDIDHLKSVVNKMAKELKSVGFKQNNISSEEQKVLNEFTELLNKD